MGFIDIHCHLDMLERKGLDKVVEKARKKKVGIILTNGINLETNRISLKLSEEYEEVRSALGIYPSEIEKMNDSNIKKEVEFIRKQGKNGKVFAIGEVGMDFKNHCFNRKKQEMYFRKFIGLSRDLGVPVIVHSRKAEKECIEVLAKMGAKNVIMHYFSGRLNLVEKIIKKGWFLSIPTAVVFSEHFQKIVERTPLKNLFCETDSPYSHPKKRFPNKPENVIESYKIISKIKGMVLKDVEKQIEKNYRGIFNSP